MLIDKGIIIDIANDINKVSMRTCSLLFLIHFSHLALIVLNNFIESGAGRLHYKRGEAFPSYAGEANS